MTVTLDPAFASGDVTLSNGDLTVTCTGTSGPTTITRATVTNTGKLYIEWTPQVGTETAEQNEIGLCNASALAGNWLGSDTNSTGFVGTGNVYYNGGAGQVANTFTDGNVIAMAWDTVAGLFWFKNLTTASNWNNSGTANPATGVGGFNIFVTGPFYAAVTTSALGNENTINFGRQALTGVVPSGFSLYDPPPAGTILPFPTGPMSGGMQLLTGGMRG